MNKIFAPFTPEQVIALNAFQASTLGHPFTCGGNRTDENHLDGEGKLAATEAGWICPYCDYRQDWAHAPMAEPAKKEYSSEELKQQILDIFQKIPADDLVGMFMQGFMTQMASSLFQPLTTMFTNVFKSSERRSRR